MSIITPRRYVGYPNSVLGGRQGTSGPTPSAAAKGEAVVPLAQPRRNHVKIESPSVVAAAKKAAVETIDDESSDVELSSHSEEETLVCKSKSSKACSGEESLSPTKSKL